MLVYMTVISGIVLTVIGLIILLPVASAMGADGQLLEDLFGIALTLLAELMAAPLSRIFVGYDPALFEMTKHSFRLFALSFLIGGLNIFSSAFFTALNNGGVSATISFARTLLFQSASVLIFPVFFGIDGIWLAVTVAELQALAFTLFFFHIKKKTVSLRLKQKGL